MIENLAKLMSSENIGVTYGNTSSAYFNVETRTLIIPNWEGLKDIETQMLIAHEIGHALYTPAKDWKKAIQDNEPSEIFQQYLNIVEDARIEKLVKRKFPGSKKIFWFGYNEISKRKDIFPEDISDLSFIDYLNLHYKLSGIRDIPLTKEHQYFISKMDLMETFQDAIDIAKELFNESKHDFVNIQVTLENSENSENEELDTDNTQETDESDDDSEPISKKVISKPKKEKDLKQDKNEESQQKTKTQSGEEQEFKIGGRGSEKANTPQRSKTHNSIDESLKKKISDKKIYVANIPDPILSNIIRSYKDVISDFEPGNIARYNAIKAEEVTRKKFILDDDEDDSFDIEEETLTEKELADLTQSNNLNTFMKKRSSVISYHKQLFEMRKKAIEHKRTMTFRSGLLDMNKLHSYKYDDQIFKTFQVKESGKKHGLIFFLDMSGSMHSYIRGAIDKMLEIVLFCRATNIPFTVYGFTTTDFTNLPKFTNYGTMEHIMYVSNEFSLIEFLTHTMTAIEFKKAFEILSKKIGLSNRNSISDYGLYGTPLNETILCLDSIVSKFRNATNAQIVNVVFFTDGYGSDYFFTKNVQGEENKNLNRYWDNIYSEKSKYGSRTCILYDKKIKKNFFLEDKEDNFKNENVFKTSILLEVMRSRMKSVNILNYYITNDFWSLLTSDDFDKDLPKDMIDAYASDYSRASYAINRQYANNILIKTKNKINGFDRAYIISTNFFENKRTKQDLGKDKDSEFNEIKYNFLKISKNKKLTNKLISDFIDMIV